MNTSSTTAQEPPLPNTDSSASEPAPAEGLLTIGDLARETGVSAERLRMWESRYGFPVARRLPSGHRRYPAGVVEEVRAVVRLQEAGSRLEQAIERAVVVEQTPASVFAQLRRGHAHLLPTRLRKSTLIALSWAIEDECCAQASRPLLFGAFQYAHNYAPAEQRWRELARVSEATLVLADFGADTAATPDGPVKVSLPADAPMLREWTVVCDAPDFPAALAAWEIPGQQGVPDLDRIYEAVWTIEPRAVREAARVCASVALDAGCAEAAPILYRLASSPDPSVGDLASITTLFNRVVAYVDRGVGGR